MWERLNILIDQIQLKNNLQPYNDLFIPPQGINYDNFLK